MISVDYRWANDYYYYGAKSPVSLREVGNPMQAPCGLYWNGEERGTIR